MLSFRKRRLQCFYCGHNSAREWNNTIRRWQCQDCEAVNYLDAHGEITDPPISATTAPKTPSSKPTRFARPVEGLQSPVPEFGGAALFCRTCQKNQNVVAQALAGYLPGPEDPSFALREKQLPSYREGLEERYPQVCEQCAPRVEAQIRNAGYVAKTDYLRRVLESSKKRRTMGIGEWNTVGVIGAVVWWTGVVGYVLWYGVNLMDVVVGPVRIDGSRPSMLSCVETVVRNGLVPQPCMDSFGELAGYLWMVTLAGIWWNPTIVRVTNRKRKGLGEFYLLQTLLHLLRAIAAIWLRDFSDDLDDQSISKAINATMLVITLGVNFTSLRCAGLVSGPSIDFGNEASSIKIAEPDRPSPNNVPAQTQPVTPGPDYRRHAASVATSVYSQTLTPPDTAMSETETEIDPRMSMPDDKMDLDTPQKPEFTPRKPIPQQQIDTSAFSKPIPEMPQQTWFHRGSRVGRMVSAWGKEERRKVDDGKASTSGFAARRSPQEMKKSRTDDKDGHFGIARNMMNTAETGLETLFGSSWKITDRDSVDGSAIMSTAKPTLQQKVYPPAFGARVLLACLLGIYATSTFQGVSKPVPAIWATVATLGLSCQKLGIALSSAGTTSMSDILLFGGQMALSLWLSYQWVMEADLKMMPAILAAVICFQEVVVIGQQLLFSSAREPVAESVSTSAAEAGAHHAKPVPNTPGFSNTPSKMQTRSRAQNPAPEGGLAGLSLGQGEISIFSKSKATPIPPTSSRALRSAARQPWHVGGL